jgi:two-component system sensor histidine kinase MtrB
MILKTRPRHPRGAVARSTHRRWSPPLGLRARATIAFGITGLVVAVVLAAVTYGLVRGYLVDQREDAATRQAYVNARLARSFLRTDSDVGALLNDLGGGAASESVLRHDGEWYSTSVDTGPDSIPRDLLRLVGDGHAGHQRYHDPNGELRLAVGVPVAATGSSYFELYPLDELDRTLSVLATSLLTGVVAASVVAAGVGRVAAGRLVRPLAPVADAAERIAGGALDTRLAEIDDPDLRRLAEAFNTMAAALEERIEREARFAADVSHELRSPLTAVAAAVEIIERRRDQLPPQVTEAFAILTAKIATFQQMVLDLLEISRLDAGTASLSVDSIDLEHFVTGLLAHHGAAAATVTMDDDAPSHVRADRRRLAQAMGNIVDNAERYAGGVVRVTITRGQPGRVQVGFEDEGAGVPHDERLAIFGRFARGEAGVRAGGSSGTGLGLSLVAEHLRLHGGDVWVEDSPLGGARFVLELPVDVS